MRASIRPSEEDTIRFMSMSGWAKGLALGLTRRMGYDVRRSPRDASASGALYGPVTPVATYSPWNADPAFLAAYHAVSASTLVDLYRCYELWSLVEQSRTLSGCLIEVGVWRGGSGTLIADAASTFGIADPVYLCDTFGGVVKASERDPAYRGGEHADTSARTVEKLLASRNLTNARILEGIFPEETGPLVAESTFRFCHVDVDVYLSARDAAEWLWPRLVPGGTVVYDDYGFEGCAGVTRWVDEQASGPDRVVVRNLNGHAIVVKTG